MEAAVQGYLDATAIKFKLLAQPIRIAITGGTASPGLFETMHVIAAKAVAFGEALKPAFVTYQGQVVKNCQVLAKGLLALGYELVSGGTDNHLVLVDLTNKDVTGKDAEQALDLAGITVNKNTVPFETRSPFVTSGVRIGTAALTTRGMLPGTAVYVNAGLELGRLDSLAGIVSPGLLLSFALLGILPLATKRAVAFWRRRAATSRNTLGGKS